MLNIQSLLKSGKTVAEVCDPLGIKYTPKDGKVIFSYSQIDSPKNDPVVKESRGLILYSDNWDVAAYPFRRFLNYGEDGVDTLPEDLTLCHVLEKLDGTMCNLYWDRVLNKWQMATRKMMYGEGSIGPINAEEVKVGGELTFAELFWIGAEKTHLKRTLGRDFDYFKDFTFCFELTSKFNRIVTRYTETEITLLTVRNNKTLSEVRRTNLNRFGEDFGCKVVKAFGMKDWQALRKMEGLEPTFEGFVIVHEQSNGNHLRAKLKNPSYLAISKLVSSQTDKAFIELLKTGEQSEYLSYFPEFRPNIERLVDKMLKIEYTVREDWNRLNVIEDKKAFALEALKCKFPSILFALKNNKVCLYSLKSYIVSLRTDNLLEWMKNV